ncbi:hypothetical protein M2302_004618 [Micromonospora sp. A200]|nr:hypothetical protein [Micromonospora sp. A200]
MRQPRGDNRGILDPERLRREVRFRRHLPAPALRPWVEHYWLIDWAPEPDPAATETLALAEAIRTDRGVLRVDDLARSNLAGSAVRCISAERLGVPPRTDPAKYEADQSRLLVANEIGKLLTHPPGRYALEAVNQPRQGHLGRVVDLQVHVFAFAVELDQLALEVGAHRPHHLLPPHQVPVSTYAVPELCHEDQVGVQGGKAMPAGADVAISVMAQNPPFCGGPPPTGIPMSAARSSVANEAAEQRM